MNLSIDHLEAFVAAVECGSFSAAGRRLGKVQSAVSSAVANLEIDVGVSLFDRTGKYPKLTLEGEALLREARHILAGCNDFIKRAYSFGEGGDARIRLGIDEIVPSDFLLEILQDFDLKFPQTELEVLYGSLKDIEIMVQEDRVDLGVLVPLAIPAQSLQSKLLTHMSFQLVVSADHPLARKKNMSSADLAAWRQLLVTSRGGEHEPEEVIYSKSPWMIESTSVILELVRRGVGYSYLPDFLVEKEVEAGTLTVISMNEESIPHHFPIYLIWPYGKTYGNSQQWLMERLSVILKG